MHIRSIFGFALLALLLAGCVRFYSWNQRLTLFVNTPDGPMSASSVTHVDITDYPYGLPAATNSMESTLTGEAIVMLLPNGQYLFVLLPGETIALNVFSDPSRRSPHHFRYAEKQVGKEPVIIPHKYGHRMVTFTEANNPLSAVKVTPENFKTVFGSGYAFEKLTIQITDDQVTTGNVIDALGPDYFRKWVKFKRSNLQVASGGFIRDLGRREFIRTKQ